MNTMESKAERGVALLAVLFALTLLMLLALPFAVSMTVGADAAMRDVEETSVQQASASVREMLLAEAVLSHPSIDPTPAYDGLDEWPGSVELPKAFGGVADSGRVALGGQLVDLQRFLHLDSCSPLLLANAIGTTTRLREDLLENSGRIVVEDATNLPDSGVVWIAGELIRYGEKDGNSLGKLERGLLYPEFREGKEPIGATALVLDYRCVIAAAWPFLGPDPSRRTRRPYRAVGELLESANAGFGTFTAAEMDALQRVFSVDTMAANAATWGRPERIFTDLEAGKSRVLTVKSALHLGAGSTVRLRNLRTGDVEYGLVMAAGTQRGVPELALPSVFQLQLLFLVGQSFPATDTVVEPLIPVPVNVNTASPEVLTVLLSELRTAADVRAHEGDGPRPTLPRSLGVGEARHFADAIETLRRPANTPGSGPFTGWRDFVERLWKPRFEEVKGNTETQLWVSVYRNLQTGRDSTIEMGTAPVCFQSGPWVAYRAAASRSRSAIAPGVVGRHERSGVAAAVPGFFVERRWATQDVLEEAFQLDRRSPYWVTHPINLGALQPIALGNDPAARYFPHLFALAYPGMGFGELRFPAVDEADAGLSPAPATAPSGPWNQQTTARGVYTFAQTLDIRGHDVKKDGPFLLQNTGPSAPGAQRPQNQGQNQQGRGRHDRLAFPFSNNNGFVDRFGISFWLEPQTLANAVLFDHGDDNPDRNRLSVQARDGNLVFEVIDEAGLDPNPGASPAGVERTASEWSLPLAELGLPNNTPVHVAVSAMSGRPADLSFAVDGMTRGKPRYATYLTAALKVLDPNLGNNRAAPGTPGAARNERYLDVQVDSTEGFPPVGVLRIGLELFEYSAIRGNSFQCQWKDSLGGRGARQWGREHRPGIPTDANGKPTVNLDDPQFQDVNLDVFPEHPVGSAVELYGYSVLPSEDSPMMLGSTSLDGALGAFAVARAFIDQPRPIVIAPAQGNPFQLGLGIDETWSGDLLLADPLPTGRNQPPAKAQAEIHDAFPATGGYAMLVQRAFNWDVGMTPAQSTTGRSGGIEVIRYERRDGNKLMSVQRAQRLPGVDGQINRDFYDGQAERFITDFTDWPVDPTNAQVIFDDIPTWITWVVPISLAVQNTKALWDPQATGLTEWVQLYPKGGDVNDTEWVRYDTIQQNKHLVRANRAAWSQTYFQLTQELNVTTIRVGPLGPDAIANVATTPPWGTVTATAGFIGYTPKLESTFPQIRAVRGALAFRGDPFTETSSHAHSASDVMGCHRLQLLPGNFGAYTGRVGRNDRVALVQGSLRAGGRTPIVEWHTVNWQARRYFADNLQRNQTPTERYGPWPFQLVAFQAPVQNLYMGPPTGTQYDEPRLYDRVVKFPSGELPAAYCAEPTVGAGIGNSQPMQGFVDEVEVVQHLAQDLVLDEEFDENAKIFRVNRGFYLNSAGAVATQADLSVAFPQTGGLVAIDGEILAYQSHANGEFTLATNGRGLLNTEPRGHDRGARVRFLTHRPAAILAAGVGLRDAELPVQARGALPERYGTVLLGRELLHYTWVRTRDQQALLEMPRWFPPGDDRTSSQSRGLFRGRFGSAPQAAAAGEAIIGFPFRYWDRHVDRSDDPELAYSQLTLNEAPVYFRSVRWREETVDPRVEVVCLVRADGKLRWEDEPLPAAGLWELRGGSADTPAHRLGHQGSRLELRFATRYKPGCLDLVTFRAHGWKTTARVEDVRVEYEGQGRIFDEQVTAR